MIQNKALWIFPNIKESVDMLPQKLRGQAWEMIINYAFGDENVEQSCKNLKVLLAFRIVKPLLRLRGIAGSQGGKSNNPSGLTKRGEPNIALNIASNITPNITPNSYITETETETETDNINKKKNKQKEKISFSDVVDWESLFTFWEENKKGGSYKNTDSRNRMLAKLRELTGNDFELAKAAIRHCIDNDYQGFCNGKKLFYMADKVPKSGGIGEWDKTPETYTVGDY